MTKMKKWVAVALVVTMVGGSLAACGSSDSDSESTDETSTETASQEDTSEEDDSSSSSSSGETYKIGYNYYSEGNYALTTLASNIDMVIEAFGDESVGICDDSQVDKIIQDVENMISSGCDGVILWLPADNLYETAIDLCTEAGVAFAFADKVPDDEELIAELMENEYFAGAVGPANAEYGTLTAEYALAQGYTSCIISSNTADNVTDAPRVEAFTEAFEAGGGTVEEISYCDSSDLITQYVENTLLAHPDVDFIYATGSDYGIGSVQAVENQGLDVKVLTSGLDSACVELLTSGDTLEYVIGDYWVSGTLAAVAMENYLEGNPLTDENGDIIYVTDIMPFQITADTYDDYVATFVDSDFYSTEELQAMDGITYDGLMDVIDAFSLEERVAAHE